MTRAKLVELTQGPVRKLLVAGGGDLVHVVVLDAEGRALAQVQMQAEEAEALEQVLREMRGA